MERFVFAIAMIISATTINNAQAHPGRTDSNGGHYDRKNGGYHYHGGGGPSSSGLRTTGRVSVRSTPRVTARSATRTIARTSVASQSVRDSLQTKFEKAKDLFEDAVAQLRRIETDHPGTDEARKAQDLLLSLCQDEQKSVDSRKELEAKSKLRLAKALMDRGKTTDYVQWLKEIVKDYADTEAGKEAARELRKWE